MADDSGEARPGHGGTASLVVVGDPYAAFMALLDHFHPGPSRPAPGIDPSARVSPTASLGRDVTVGANAVIGERCSVGDRTVVSHGALLGDDVAVGEDSLLMENVVVRYACRLGRRVTLHPGVIIGSDGFGFAPRSGGAYEKIPQRGTVVIEDDVEIGANTTIDRATLGETRICRGAKLDNLIQIGHNVLIGEDTVIVAQAGIAGSTKIGKHCVIAGKVGIVGHVTCRQRDDRRAVRCRSPSTSSQTYSSSRRWNTGGRSGWWGAATLPKPHGQALRETLGRLSAPASAIPIRG